MEIQSVKGPVDTSRMGVTLAHEHLFVRSEGVHEAFPSVWEPEASVAEAVRGLAEAASFGVQTIVDLTVLGLGRDIQLIRRVAEQVQVNIIVGTGIYTFSALPPYFENRGIDHMAELFVRDVQQGIQGTGIRAAILKCATDEPGLTPGVEKVLRAVARAHKETGVPICTHTHAITQRGLEQQQIFKDEGVDLGRVVIGHSGDTDDIEYLTKLVEAGSYIGMDRWGLDLILPFEKRVATVVKMCQLGYVERMILSHDFCSYVDHFPVEATREMAPRWSFTHIFREALPALREAGLTEKQIQQMMIENPRAIFEGR